MAMLFSSVRRRWWAAALLLGVSGCLSCAAQETAEEQISARRPEPAAIGKPSVAAESPAYIQWLEER